MAEPQFTQTESPFSLICAVTMLIQARAEHIWDLLTDAKGFPRWSSTITAIEGHIAEGKKIRLHVPGTERSFAPRVWDMMPDRHMTWSGGFLPLFLGVRKFHLRSGAHVTEFSMEERFSGLMMPLIRGSLPDFGPVFTQFAVDLKQEAERA